MIYKSLLIIVSLIVLIGCGADSDLLRDQNINKKPSGKAYDFLKEDIYNYRNDVNQTSLGFEYIALTDECNTKDCTLLEALFLFENNESTNVALEKKIVLTKNGWFEKSKHRECEVTFSGSSITEICPDGRKTKTKVVKIDLEGVGLGEVENSKLYMDKIKDTQATFTFNSAKYTFENSSEFSVYEAIDTDLSKCKTPNNVNARNDVSLNQYTALVCSINGIGFNINNVNASAGIFTMNGSAEHNTWQKTIVHGKYTSIDLGLINGIQYFIAPYNSFIYIGRVISEKSSDIYLNTEAFNVVYTQLQDKYKQ